MTSGIVPGEVVPDSDDALFQVYADSVTSFAVSREWAKVSGKFDSHVILQLGLGFATGRQARLPKPSGEQRLAD